MDAFEQILYADGHSKRIERQAWGRYASRELYACFCALRAAGVSGDELVRALNGDSAPVQGDAERKIIPLTQN